MTIRTLSIWFRLRFVPVLILCTASSSARVLICRAHALDKQASAHAGQVAGSDHGLGLSGSVLAGVALVNPTYAARPDNTGHALARVAPHVDFDLIGTRLSIPVDINLFSDRDRRGLGKLAPSELDVITGLTSTWPVGVSAIEIGARVEGDFPVDRGGLSQKYVDARVRWLFSLDKLWAGLNEALPNVDVAGAATLGWFAVNPSYAARPDNSGRALLRYALHLSAEYAARVFLALDFTFFTDRRDGLVVPSELDFTPEIGVNLVQELALHLAYERDMPVDRGGLVQHFLMLNLTWGFSLISHPT